ncbi:hypothetical protein [Cellulomonas sp. IC4_254]|uniref:hypothetical protein n=1 Tax=Cellulomonas sp. IC4_254 TaxID=2714040 RepID=UPI00141F688A|nr:hypothetical protein [Cellulomonas sp. IC4_254]NHT17300.1 hypothetical protein [Cellulomonas sp. IC4_254]
MDAEVHEARRADRAGRAIDVIVTVKATPQPSASYGETVCVAGIATDPLRLVRLYPVPFRFLTETQRFPKYSILRVRVRSAGSDARPESLKIDASSVQVIRPLKDWRERAPYVEPLVGGSMCSLVAAAAENPNAQSLGLVTVGEFHSIDVKPHPGWTPAELQRFARFAEQGDLFRADVPQMRQAPRFKAWLRFTCPEDSCTQPHRVGMLDWELTALQGHLRDRPDHEVVEAIRFKFGTQMFGPGRATALYLGNQENVTRRRQFMVLGTYYPPERLAAAPLFQML